MNKEKANYYSGKLLIHPDCIKEFTASFEFLQSEVHKNAIAKGWWEEDRSDGELIALIHSELSEALEWLRNGDGQSNHIPEFKGVEEEYADVIIRIMDLAEKRGLNIADAIIAKMQYNKTRPYKHGKKF